ncbi:MAG: hypothetical protein WC551_06515 [Patescibacteria group bacterium]
MSHSPSDRAIPDLSTLTSSEYAELDTDRILLVHALAFKANRNITRRAFADPSVAWVLVAGAPGKIVVQGGRQERLLDAQIDEMEKQSDQVWYFYSRPDELVEEIPRRDRGASIACDPRI